MKFLKTILAVTVVYCLVEGLDATAECQYCDFEEFCDPTDPPIKCSNSSTSRCFTAKILDNGVVKYKKTCQSQQLCNQIADLCRIPVRDAARQTCLAAGCCDTDRCEANLTSLLTPASTTYVANAMPTATTRDVMPTPTPTPLVLVMSSADISPTTAMPSSSSSSSSRAVKDIDCPCDWTSLSSSCYFFSTTKTTWPKARADCLKRGGDLVVPTNVNKDTAIWNEVNRRKLYNPWIGISRSYVDNQFHTVHGSKVSYTNWRPGEPNYPKTEHCGTYWTMTSTGRFGWNNADCYGWEFHFICELQRTRC